MENLFGSSSRSQDGEPHGQEGTPMVVNVIWNAAGCLAPWCPGLHPYSRLQRHGQMDHKVCQLGPRLSYLRYSVARCINGRCVDCFTELRSNHQVCPTLKSLRNDSCPPSPDVALITTSISITCGEVPYRLVCNLACIPPKASVQTRHRRQTP